MISATSAFAFVARLTVGNLLVAHYRTTTVFGVVKAVLMTFVGVQLVKVSQVLDDTFDKSFTDNASVNGALTAELHAVDDLKVHAGTGPQQGFYVRLGLDLG